MRAARRVPRPGGLRRPDRGLHPDRPDRPHERDVRVRRVSGPRRRADGHRDADARPRRPRRAQGLRDPRRVPARDPRVRGRDARSVSERSDRAASSPAGATRTTCCATSSPPSSRGMPGSASRSSRRASSCCGPSVGEQTGVPAVTIPISYDEQLSWQSSACVATEHEDVDRALLERVAQLIAPYCLVGWDTGGERLVAVALRRAPIVRRPALTLHLSEANSKRPRARPLSSKRSGAAALVPSPPSTRCSSVFERRAIPGTRYLSRSRDDPSNE